ncbi:UNVERIFIED_CONTAM: hypothetical protein Sindi_1625600 [Sesamum indicum]
MYRFASWVRSMQRLSLGGHLEGDRRRSLRQAIVAARHLIDKEDVDPEAGGKEREGSSPREEEREISPSLLEWGSSILKTSGIDQLIRKYHISPAFIIYTPSPTLA